MNRTGVEAHDLYLIAREWFGYGRWSAPYWFIGPEPSMGRGDDDSLNVRCRAWVELGRGELVDCIEHHRAFGVRRWHRTRPATQPTWRQLIRLVLAYKAEPTELEAVREYQRTQWGTAQGEVCVVELCAHAAPSLRTPRDRQAFRQERIDVLRTRIKQHEPTFVVCYGAGNCSDWEALAGGPFGPDGRRWMGRTVLVEAKHPVGGKPAEPASYWTDLGEELRRVVGEGR